MTIAIMKRPPFLIMKYVWVKAQIKNAAGVAEAISPGIEEAQNSSTHREQCRRKSGW